MLSGKATWHFAAVERQAGREIQNRSPFGDYDRYWNFLCTGFIFAVSVTVVLSAYNNATPVHAFNQTDASWTGSTGAAAEPWSEGGSRTIF